MTQDDIATAAPAAPLVPSSGTVSHLHELAEAAELAVVTIGIDGSLVEANDAGVALFPSRSLPGSPHDGYDRLRAVLEQIPQRLLVDPEGGTWHGEIDLAVPGAPRAVHHITVLVHHDAVSVSGGYIGVVCRDITDERARSAELLHLLEHDPTTGLLNRTAALERIAHALLRPDDDGGELAILMIDVDRLRDVNDALGHDIGDRLLASTAKRLSTAVRPDDVVARLGSDEFMVLCHSVADPTIAMDLADRIRRALTGRLTIRQLELDVSVSVGVGMSDPDIRQLPTEQAATQLISRADTAVHAAKQAGRARTAMFTPQLHSRAKVRTELAAALSKALRDGQLYLEYQPIFSAVSERAEAAEALIRWAHPVRGRVEASEFIPVAEDTGVIVPIGDWVLQQACATTRRWIDDGVVGQRFAVHVNVSRLQLANPAFVNRVVDLLREHRLRPRQIVLEAREATLLGTDADEVIRSVRALRRVGVRVALDNFGTGSNALSLLTDIGADVLKLDGSLALPSGASEADTRVVRALVLLAHALNMEVVAERVTGLEQLRRLRAAGCDLVQGHLVGKPCAPDELIVHMQL
ncbi:MAG: bifunctional diguanylate cyclase/phosphodiesterase [Ilumatobacteraceae bacterium]